jgi:predicted  nucleic acid-binding Zn-ribbon protein
MLINDALNHARNQRDALEALILEAKHGHQATELKQENQSLKNKLQKLERELKQCKNLNIHLTYILASVNNVEICKHCNGEGGFDAGEDSCECPVCNGSGYVKIEVKQ